jgi:protein TonB
VSSDLPFVSAESEQPERLGFIVAMAAVMHIALILGISFAPDDSQIKMPSLEITLAQYRSKTPPKQADYLAQYDQSGSGQLNKKAELSSTSQSDFHDNTAPAEEALKLAKNQASTAQASLLSTRSKTERNTVTQTTRMQVQKQQQQGPDDQTALTENISALEAQLEKLNQSYARMPRPKFITSVATRGSPDALYLNRWEKHVEIIGNANYPEEARKQGIEGELRLLLLLLPNGNIDEVRILSSSGNAILDRAANQIVRKAAPYEGIPADVLDGKNRLGIVRTWRFERQGLKTKIK